jgi:hypothetical protein
LQTLVVAHQQREKRIEMTEEMLNDGKPVRRRVKKVEAREGHDEPHQIGHEERSDKHLRHQHLKTEARVQMLNRCHRLLLDHQRVGKAMVEVKVKKMTSPKIKNNLIKK